MTCVRCTTEGHGGTCPTHGFTPPKELRMTVNEWKVVEQIMDLLHRTYNDGWGQRKFEVNQEDVYEILNGDSDA